MADKGKCKICGRGIRLEIDVRFKDDIYICQECWLKSNIESLNALGLTHYERKEQPVQEEKK